MIPVRAPTGAERAWLIARHKVHWGGTMILRGGMLVDAGAAPSLVAHGRAGYLTYLDDGRMVECLTLAAEPEGQGTGRALLAGLEALARARGRAGVHLTTTNDNTRALRFYQRAGYTLLAFRREAVTKARYLKPGLPAHGRDGIPIRDELVLGKSWENEHVR